MQLDFEDILSGAFGRIIALFLFIVSAVWVGSLVGGIAWMVGRSGFSQLPSIFDLFMSPLLLINLWIIPNVALLAIMTSYLLVSDESGHAAWGVIVGFESLFVMLGWCLNFSGVKDTALAWSCWLVLLVMLETGIWLDRQMRTNRWAREMAQLRAENAMRIAQRTAVPADQHGEDTD
ncbi:MAG: hypothetical protein V4584_08060 [Verrucomicrobiota bacterium]